MLILFPNGVSNLSTPVSKMKYWNGTAWVIKPLKYFNGASWVTKPIKYWNGSAWI